MCLNGYYNDKQTILSHNTFNYQWYLEKVKDLRRNLILNSIDLFEIEIHPSFCYYVQSEYLLALGLKSQNPDFCSVLKQAKSIISDPRECAEGNNDYKRIMMLQKIVANCYRRRGDYCIYEKECFLPFIQYELGKDMNSCNLNNLLGLISNKFRDAW